MVRLERLKKTYAGVPILRDISLEIPAHGMYGIIGKSGAGKSTLLRIMSLLEKPDEGAVFYHTTRVDLLRGAALRAQRRRIGLIFQQFHLFSSRTVFGNVAYPLEIARYARKDAYARVLHLLHLVGLADKAQARISTLSGGQKQRVAIARALAAEPAILFCDEATSALDPQTTQSILTLLKNVQCSLRLTVVLITHQMEVVRDLCDRAAVLHEGEIVEEGRVTQLFAAPRRLITQQLLSGCSFASFAKSEPFHRMSSGACAVHAIDKAHW
ncbi:MULTISPECIES: methionine ABC transporter ATP-binding protein [Treponema]|uniref:Amino acid ABC transporter, ATP-binding protein (Abc) n=6 Tax=Treponema TaxID=157 RepID=O83157_TREPA|nr:MULTISPECIES: methionine ABC transporter ATP-binding protein [Treponema]AAC65110.1 amino acid ABC transporter, ATP-binding protein (abc) [Treponema pallidum subsp. pallidum str. Nichols]ACD70547.1 amino acid ABC transporter, ATP-binding protein [Treponema pallidum subsp. pallidum SS14]ADD72274.1 methionine import ATP-binding protein MetN [Treponema pallidum subsp. pallidum str. Chicago]AEH40076.1 methionine ABC superfamily ATP binding cassette transporter, ABC protein [Treponema paraluiscuni